MISSSFLRSLSTLMLTNMDHESLSYLIIEAFQFLFPACFIDFYGREVVSLSDMKKNLSFMSIMAVDMKQNKKNSSVRSTDWK